MRMGPDLGGTKIELAVFDDEGNERLRRRTATPHSGYDDALHALGDFVARCGERKAGAHPTASASACPAPSRRAAGACSTPTTRRSMAGGFKQDLEQKLEREVRFANDANCFALSEALDGAGKGAGVVFGAILGTGAGGGIVVHGEVLHGHNALAGRVGPYAAALDDGRRTSRTRCALAAAPGCIEQWVAGPAL